MASCEAAALRISQVRLSLFTLVMTATALAGCGPTISRYALVEESLRAGDPKRADQVIEQSEGQYGSKSRVLYLMDRGTTLQLAGRYRESTALLEEAEAEVEQLYTRRLHTEAKAFLVNDTELPYEGDPYEQVMINVLKALNYAVLGELDEALVEARRIDHHLNVLSDRVGEKAAYRDDPFARYLSGVLYEATGDWNNAFIAYRKAYDSYQQAESWTRVPIPPTLRADLLRMTEVLHLNQEHEEYRRAFGKIAWRSAAETSRLAQVIVIGYNGRAPHKEDQFIDLPVSLDALNLVLLTKGLAQATGHQNNRAAESALYGLSGNVVRVALPKLVTQKTEAAYEDVTATGEDGTFHGRTELAQNVTALGERSLADRFASISVKAVARAAVKYALARGAGYGARAAAGGTDIGPLVGLLVERLATTLAVASEEADKRSWRTLPDEIQLGRLWVRPGTYQLRVRPVGRSGGTVGPVAAYATTLQVGETRFFIERVLP